MIGQQFGVLREGDGDGDCDGEGDVGVAVSVGAKNAARAVSHSVELRGCNRTPSFSPDTCPSSSSESDGGRRNGFAGAVA